MCKPEAVAQFEPLYEERFKEALRRIVDNIPEYDLLIQWDLPYETLVLEYDRGSFTMPLLEMWFEPVLGGLLDRITRAASVIPSGVPLGFHLCYGDLEHKHIYEPKDTTLMVELTHSLMQALSNTHKIEYVHMPVPKDRSDTKYFRSLQDLRLPEHTRLYLGLVHARDEDGTLGKIKTVKSVYSHPFGVATECGLGRTPPEDIDSILGILKNVTNPV